MNPIMEGQELIPPIEPNKKKTPKKKFLATLLVIGLVVLVAGMALGAWNPLDKTEEEQEGVFDIAGYTFFELPDDTYGTYVLKNNEKLPIQFRLDPRNASNYYIDTDVVQNLLKSGKIYITFNPNQKDLAKIAVASLEISRITGLYGIQTVGAYTEDSKPVNENVPIRTCKDADDKTSVILMQISDENKITTKDNCVYVSAETVDELILIADKLGMNLLGINV